VVVERKNILKAKTTNEEIKPPSKQDCCAVLSCPSNGEAQIEAIIRTSTKKTVVRNKFQVDISEV